MNKEEFKIYENDCKKFWQTLAETGGENKPLKSKIYLHTCPACEISAKVRIVLLLKEVNYIRFGGRIQFCQYCPITEWRNKARQLKCSAGDAICSDVGELYSDWVYTTNKPDRIEERKQYAKQIAELKWEWLDVYEEI